MMRIPTIQWGICTGGILSAMRTAQGTFSNLDNHTYNKFGHDKSSTNPTLASFKLRQWPGRTTSGSDDNLLVKASSQILDLAVPWQCRVVFSMFENHVLLKSSANTKSVRQSSSSSSSSSSSTSCIANNSYHSQLRNQHAADNATNA